MRTMVSAAQASSAVRNQSSSVQAAARAVRVSGSVDMAGADTRLAQASGACPLFLAGARGAGVSQALRPHLRPMHLKIETFDNAKGGNSVYKALAHPLAARAVPGLLARLREGGPVAVYDPQGTAEGFAEFYDLAGVEIAGVFVQDLTAIGRRLLGHSAQPVTDLPASGARTVLVAAFDAARLVDPIRHLVPKGAAVATFDEIRLPETLLSNRRGYLDPLNFATNFVFFADRAEQHTRLATANYWSGYGAGEVSLYLVLFGADGEVLAEWQEPVAPGAAAIVLDSREVRARFELGEFTGQLFLH